MPCMRTKIHTTIDYEARKVTKEIVKVIGNSRGFVFRIGHYSPEKYMEVKKQNENPFNYASKEEKEKKLRTSQRIWHSFRTYRREDDLDLSYNYDGVIKPVNIPFSKSMWIRIANEGWKVRWPKILSLT